MFKHRQGRSARIFLASALVATLAGSMTAAPSASAAPGCAAGTAMHIVAHQDDDLLFQSPTLIAEVRGGLCVRTVYVTAGDANDSANYWASREAGVKAAYAQLAGTANTWTTTDAGIAGHPVPVATLSGAENISLAFMRLPDGFGDGSGGSNYGYQSLQKLYSDAIHTITAVDGSSSYTLAALQGTLLALMNSYQPNQIATLDFAGSYGDSDHGDHHSVAYLVLAAQRQYMTPHTITGFQGYSVLQRPSNVSDPDLTKKIDAFLTYAQYDNKTCNTAIWCSTERIGSYLSRQYTVDPPAQTPSDGTNVAPSATITPSSQNTAAGQGAAKAVDGVISGYPGDETREWTTLRGKAGSYLYLSFPSAVNLNRVVLYDRPNSYDQITAGTLTFSDGSTVAVPTLDNAGQATSVNFTDRSTTSLRLTFTAVSSTTTNVGLSELQAYTGTSTSTSTSLPETSPTGTNVAAGATVTASSQNTASGQTALKALDGVIAGYPTDPTREWATLGGKAGSYLNLNFPSAVNLNRVVLYDRPNRYDQITAGTLTFSDGSTIAVPTLDNAGQATSVNFTGRSTTSLRLTVTAVSSTTANVGLSELQAYTGTSLTGTNAAAAATVIPSSQNTATGQTALKALDGVIAGYPTDPTREWATVGGKAGSYLNLNFPSAVTLNQVVLYDRPNTYDQITAGTLTFSDGSTVAVPTLDNAGKATTINFTGRSTTSLRLTVTTVSSTTANVGLSELQAYMP